MHKTIIVQHFYNQLKKHAKKYRSLKESLIKLLENFVSEQHNRLGNCLYKARLRAKEIPKGKNKSFRVIVYIMEFEEWLVPIAIYYKGDQDNLSRKDINDHLEEVLFELRSQKIMES